MSFLKSLLLGALALSQFTQAYPSAPEPSLEARKLYSLDTASGLDKRTLYNVDKIPKEEEKTALRTALKEAVEIAALALDKMDTDKYKDVLPGWFGSDAGHHDKVRDVFKNFVGDNKNGEGADVLGNVVVWDDDYWEFNGEMFCTKEVNGKTGTAYFKPRDGKPAMHFCPKFYTRQAKTEYLKEACDAKNTHISTELIRDFQATNVLHEFMHYSQIGKKATGEHVADPAYGARNCYLLKNRDSSKTVLNADSYVYYAMQIWLTEKCGHDFKYPQVV